MNKIVRFVGQVALAVLVFVPLQLKGEIFAQNTTWNMMTEYIRVSPPWKVLPIKMYVDGEENFNGKNCKKIWMEEFYGTYLWALVWVDSERIYICQNRDNPNWRLIYDFGIQPGESRSFSMCGSKMWESEQEGRSQFDEQTTVTCVSRDDESGMIYLKDDEYNYTWIYGVGSIAGLDRNVVYPDIIIENAQWLVSCYCNGVVLYESEENKSVEVQDSMTSKSDFYDLLGRKVRNPRHGIFINNGSIVRK